MRSIGKFFALALLSVSTNTYASKARLQALGQGENGSRYVEDKRNSFLNPAKAYRYGKWANFEWGHTATPSDPNAEGGLFYSVGSNYLGVQLGRESNAQARIATANAITPASTFEFLAPKNTVNVVFAAKGNVNWGFQVLHGSSEDRTPETTPGIPAFPNKKATTFELGAGAEGENFDIYTKIDLQYSSENEVSSAPNTHKLEGKPVVEVGGSYVLQNSDRVYGSVMTGGFDANYSTGLVKKEVRLQSFLLGYAHYINPDTDTRFFLSPALEFSDTKVKDGNGGTEQSTEAKRLPLTIGMEMTATDWLVLRSSVYQRILLDDTRTSVTDKHHENSTIVGAGAGVTWKKLILDGTFRGAFDSTGRIDGDYFLANVGMTYNF